MKRSAYISFFLPVLCIFFLTRVAVIAGMKYYVDLKNDESRQVLVIVPGGEAVTGDDDFAVIGKAGAVIAPVYPFEMQKGRFWSQPLSLEVFTSIPMGAPVSRSPLSAEEHREVRHEGSVQWGIVKRGKTNDRLFRLRDALSKKREAEERSITRLDSLEEAELAAERDLIRIEEVNERRILSIEEDIDDLFREIFDLEDDREELFQVRERLAMVEPRPEAEIQKVSDNIARVSRSVKNKRRDVVRLRERRRRLKSEIRRAERKLRDISADVVAAKRELRNVEIEVESLIAELADQERKGEKDSQSGGSR